MKCTRLHNWTKCTKLHEKGQATEYAKTSCKVKLKQTSCKVQIEQTSKAVNKCQIANWKGKPNCQNGQLSHNFKKLSKDIKAIKTVKEDIKAMQEIWKDAEESTRGRAKLTMQATYSNNIIIFQAKHFFRNKYTLSNIICFFLWREKREKSSRLTVSGRLDKYNRSELSKGGRKT